jgi:DNA-binding response OmpR family regulator
LWAIAEETYQIIVYERAEAEPTIFYACAAASPPGTLLLAILGEDSKDARVALLKAGADFCLARPISLFELEAIVRTFFRRLKNNAGDMACLKRPEEPAPAPLILHSRSRRVTWRHRTLQLSGREIALLELFIRSAGAAVSRTSLWREVWGEAQEPHPQSIDLAISRLRRKLSSCQVELASVRNFGYRIVGHFTIE